MKISPAQTYNNIITDSIDFSFLRNKFKLKNIEAKRAFQENFPHAHKFLKDKGVDLSSIRKHSAKLTLAGAITGALLLSPGAQKNLPAPVEIAKNLKALGETSAAPQKSLIDGLKEILPEKPRALTREEEKHLEILIKDTLGVNSKATLEGEHLNTTYGYIGAEQHLRRYPGDVLQNHGSFEDQKEGIAPGLGAWGYFAPSRDRLTPELVETEKWYAVVQTLYLPDWGSRQPYLRDWYKYRKVLIVDTRSGQAVVAAIADAGPAAWTGKHFGGSPEVMDHLGGPRYKKGAVILFFVDDPNNQVPLGPVEYNKINLPGVSLIQS